MLQTKGRRAELLEYCHQQRQNGHRCVSRHRNRECRVDDAGGGDVAVTKAERQDARERLEDFGSF